MRIPKASVAFIALLLVGVACTANPAADVDESEASQTSSTEAVEDPVTVTTTTTVAVTLALPESDSEFEPGAPLLEASSQPLEANTYRVDTLGTAFSITIPDDWWVQENRAGVTMFTHPESSQSRGDRDVVFVRPTQTAYPLDPSRGVTDMGRTFEIERWLDDLVDGLIVSGPSGTRLGGEDAIYFDVRISPEVGCVPSPDFCVIFAMSRGIDGVVFRKGIDYRVWWVDGGEFEPVAVVVGAGLQGEEFFEEANVILDTLAFGEWAPHPVPPGADLWELGFPSTVLTGTVKIPLAGGIQFEIQRPRYIFQNPGLANFDLSEHNGDLMMFTAAEAASGDPIETSEDVVAAVEGRDGVVLEQIDSTEIAGFDATVFDLTNGPEKTRDGDFGGQPLVSFREDNPGAGFWHAPPLGRIWVIESDRGVVMIVAESFGRNVEDLDAIIDIAEPIIESLEFIEMGE